jgi:DNA-binding NarL/FixJ family response regulator/putative methionine-R-sulfoxide reductase with GAF domain
VPPVADAAACLPRIASGPSFRGWEGRPVNSTARWPERLEHAATLLRAEGAAVLSLRDGEFTTLFSYRIGPEVDWAYLVGPEKLRAAMASDAAVTAAIAAGRWVDQAAYAVLVAIDRDANGASCLCALRRSVPFDALEVAGAYAASRLMATSIDDGRKLAAAERAGAARLVQRSLRHELEHTSDAAALSRAAALIAAGIDANGASIMLIDGAELHLRASVGLPTEMLGHRQRIGEGIAGYVAKSGEPVEVSGAVRDDRFTGTDPGAGSALSIPLRVADRVIGVLNVKRAAGGDAFDDLERTLVADLADEVARAVGPGAVGTLEPPASDPATPARLERRVETLRILAVEDHPLMRIGIRHLLEREGLTIVGLSATSTEAVEQARQGLADVALVDLNLPDAEGVDVIERLHDAAPQLPVVAFSVDGSADRVRAALRAGAIGYLTKGTPAKRVIAALRAAAAGLSALGPEEAAALAEPHDAVTLVQKAVARSLPSGFDNPPEPAAARAERPVDRSPKDALSARELELLKYLAEGYTNKEIARAMVLAEDTVKKAVQTLIAKLGATDRTHAVVLALRSDLIQ